ncbi:unnamed protein product [Arctia plantaginis]|uniref:Uncharacterized protein n=1 Tax=Arctia plantaginis TaxID=874455 RepID=A0A8S1B4L2_ARCPL|nr:unnamed protein product [Arctia plantaginis]
MNLLDNITYRPRRKRVLSESDTDDIREMSTTINTLNDETSTSLPDMSSTNCDDAQQEVLILKEQIDKLQQELLSAHAEIESLTLQNIHLTQINEEITKKTELYKNIAHSPAKRKQPQTPKKLALTNKQTQTDNINNEPNTKTKIGSKRVSNKTIKGPIIEGIEVSGQEEIVGESCAAECPDKRRLLRVRKRFLPRGARRIVPTLKL